MNFSAEEEKILKFWKENKIFEKTLKKEVPRGRLPAGRQDFVFYDGPPFATGLPHYGHILASIIKDVIPRYQTMKGKRVPRKWGWDCHGLPIENLIEKELNLKNKKEIEDYGVDKFNKKAEKNVLRYADEWKKIIPRIGRWVDMENDYKTMDMDYTESVWWVFKTLYEKGLVYEGYKPMHICPRCETTLSNFEVTQNYQEIEDISVTIKFELEDEPGTFVLAWTTTPWTLPGNVALAVGEKIEYVKIKQGGEFFYLAKNRLDIVEGAYDVIEEIKGKNLRGKKYKPLFDYYFKDKKLENHGNGWKIYVADFVATDEGTGIVHIAPAFGEEDMELGLKEKLPFVQHVGMDGKFKEEVKDFAGLIVKPKDNPRKTDEKVVEWLTVKEKIFSFTSVNHSYPFCWRCDTPLLNYASNSWFVAVEKIKKDLLKNNAQINWVPEHLKGGRFGKWLEGAHDWAVSRSRYWGAPLPVWRCGGCGGLRVVGSVDDIREQLGGLNKLFLIRHGEAENITKNIDNSLPETLKLYLTEKGKEQTKKTAENLKKEKIDMILSSPLTRTKETAEIIGDVLGLKVETDERLSEVGWGDFNNKDMAELGKIYPTAESRLRDTLFGVESGESVRQRLEDFLDEINKKYRDKNIVVVSHGDPLQIFYGLTQGMELSESLQREEPAPASCWQVYSEPSDLHRPFIDKIKLNCRCGGVMYRIPEVFDCWFESGSMPYGQAHYPFENGEVFENNFPAEFIAEGVDQTRGWFYTLLVLSTGLFNKPAFKNVIANGIILAEDGQKMSKRLSNYPDPMYVVEKYGADSLRYYLLSSPVVRGENLNFSEKGVDEVSKKVVSKILNISTFYDIYASTLTGGVFESDHVLDRWIIAVLKVLIKNVSSGLNNYELDKAARFIGDFVDDFSNWYIRRSRNRFRCEDKSIAGSVMTTKYVMEELSKIIAPFMPFLAEMIFGHAGNGESVHLQTWPEAEELSSEEKNILVDMAKVRQDVSVGLDLRLKAGIKVRQPLSCFETPNKFDDALSALMKDELNVKEIKQGKEYKLDTKITEELKEEGKVRELMRQVQDHRKKLGLRPGEEAEILIYASEEGREFINKNKTVLKNLNIKDFKFVSEKEENVLSYLYD